VSGQAADGVPLGGRAATEQLHFASRLPFLPSATFTVTAALTTATLMAWGGTCCPTSGSG
jgi:hypothetical protein